MLPPFAIAVADGNEAAMRGCIRNYGGAARRSALRHYPQQGPSARRTRRLCDGRAGVDHHLAVRRRAVLPLALFRASPARCSRPSPASTTGATIIDDVEAAPRRSCSGAALPTGSAAWAWCFCLPLRRSRARAARCSYFARVSGPDGGKARAAYAEVGKLLYEIYSNDPCADHPAAARRPAAFRLREHIAQHGLDRRLLRAQRDSMASYGAYAQNVTLVFHDAVQHKL